MSFFSCQVGIILWRQLYFYTQICACVHAHVKPRSYASTYPAISRQLVGKSAPDNPKGIVGGFEFAVRQRNLKEGHKRPWTYVCTC